ncbi:MAG: cytochrome C [Gammaproteobacteria bacterium SG8_47]|nr:MAG: cytochrome C [Gammaproteobacteria bacterium SG8_47]
MSYRTAIIAAALMAVASGAHAGGDPTKGEALMKKHECFSCHANDGNSKNPKYPKIAGQHENYIIKQLTEYKAGVRKNDQMAQVAAELSEQDMVDLAAYFSQQTPGSGIADETQVALGEKIYRGGTASGVSSCIGCHGPNGAGNPLAKFPRIGGQHASYTGVQLRAFRTGARANDAGQMMRNIASRMSDAEMEALAQYIAGLQ